MFEPDCQPSRQRQQRATEDPERGRALRPRDAPQVDAKQAGQEGSRQEQQCHHRHLVGAAIGRLRHQVVDLVRQHRGAGHAGIQIVQPAPQPVGDVEQAAAVILVKPADLLVGEARHQIPLGGEIAADHDELLADQRQPAIGGQVAGQHPLLQFQDLIVQLLNELPRPLGQGITDLHQPVGRGVRAPSQFQLLEDVLFRQQRAAATADDEVRRDVDAQRHHLLGAVLLVVVDATQDQQHRLSHPHQLGAVALAEQGFTHGVIEQRCVQQPASRLRIAIIQVQPAGLRPRDLATWLQRLHAPLAIQSQAINHVTGHPIHLHVLLVHVHRPSLHESRGRLSPGAAALRQPC
ncbi:hypothetical protein D3C84_239950 [compost metagenome]